MAILLQLQIYCFALWKIASRYGFNKNCQIIFITEDLVWKSTIRTHPVRLVRFLWTKISTRYLCTLSALYHTHCWGHKHACMHVSSKSPKSIKSYQLHQHTFSFQSTFILNMIRVLPIFLDTMHYPSLLINIISCII